MNFDILLPIKPYYAYLIMKGEKTIEVRKFLIKDPNWSGKFKCYVSKDKTSLKRIPQADRAEFAKYLGKVAFEFVKGGVMCEEALHMRHGLKDSCLTHEELDNYSKGKPLYGYRVTALKIYDKPKELGEFNRVKQCKPCESPFGHQWTWEDRHKRNTGGWNKKYRPVPIECHRCKSLVGGKDYLDKKSGCILFDYECVSKYHKPLARPPQSWQYVETPDWAEEK